MSMTDWREIQKDCEIVRRLDSSDGQKALVTLRRRDGRFCYVELRWMHPWEEDGKQLDDGYWSVERASGIFQTQELAERDASIEVGSSW